MKVLVEQSVNSQGDVPTGAARPDGLWGTVVDAANRSRRVQHL